MPKSVPDTIFDLRTVGFTYDRLSEIFDLGTRTIRRWEAGERMPDDDRREWLETLGHTIDLLGQVFTDDQIMAWMLRQHMTTRAGVAVSPYQHLRAHKFEPVMLAAHRLVQESKGAMA